MGKLALNRDYANWLTTLKQKIRKNQIKAAIRVNETLLRLYWDMGREINERQKKSKWGSGFLAQLSKDLLAEFPDMKGFSLSNLKDIRKFYSFYAPVIPIYEQVAHKSVSDAPIERLEPPAGEMGAEPADEIGEQLADQLEPADEIGQQVVHKLETNRSRIRLVFVMRSEF